MKELINIQSFLKAPKDKRNTFGGYNYRSCESVLEAVKPLLKAEACTLTINDDIVQVGERYYIKATATLRNSSGESVSATALAREEETKKGMDGAQVTGAASSYARKYALNGLFAIDDTKDPDTDEHYKRTHQADQPKPKAKLVINDAMIDNKDRLGKMLKVLEAAYAKDPQGFAVIRHLRDELGAEFEDNADKRVLEIWMQHVVENHL
ncbi:MAG: ERF family protein [Alistipes sp.]|nr:ERF family protein [Alistipes sp.]MBQ5903148.1 ERF family protein [Alistipes sp.]